MIGGLSRAAEALALWVAAPLSGLGLLAMMVHGLAPGRWLFDAGYACEPNGAQLRLHPRGLRLNWFIWWLLGLGLLLVGLGMLALTPMIFAGFGDRPPLTWSHWLLFIGLTLGVMGCGAFMCWLGSKLMRSRWFGRPLRETRFCVAPGSGERSIEIYTATLLLRSVVHYPIDQLRYIAVSERDSLDAGVVTFQRVRSQQRLARLALRFAQSPPIELTVDIDAGELRPMVNHIHAWCDRVELRVLDDLPPITPFNF